MNAEQVLEMLDLLQRAGMVPWVDGGWGVDALLGEQTRQHGDLDLVLPAGAVPAVRSLLVEAGFDVIRDSLPTALAVRHPDGREVDLHPIDPTPDGGGDQVQPDGRRWHYDPPLIGVIGRRDVLCWCLPTEPTSATSPISTTSPTCACSPTALAASCQRPTAVQPPEP